MRTLLQICLFGLAGFLWFAFAQPAPPNYPQDFFRWPIEHAIRVSGTFGELRSNHFHAGIDLKSRRGAIGDPILAAGEGYISRIKIESRGYGNSLYLTHPNGYTTLYAHLSAFTPEIKAYADAGQTKSPNYPFYQ
ncbi:MAG: M23 family metallopeptidase, partial [Bacteroidota bacterium]